MSTTEDIEPTLEPPAKKAKTDNEDDTKEGEKAVATTTNGVEASVEMTDESKPEADEGSTSETKGTLYSVLCDVPGNGIEVMLALCIQLANTCYITG